MTIMTHHAISKVSPTKDQQWTLSDNRWLQTAVALSLCATWAASSRCNRAQCLGVALGTTLWLNALLAFVVVGCCNTSVCPFRAMQWHVVVMAWSCLITMALNHNC